MFVSGQVGCVSSTLGRSLHDEQMSWLVVFVSCIVFERTWNAHFHNHVNCSFELLSHRMRTQFLGLSLACWPNLCSCLTANGCFNLQASGHWNDDQGHVWLVGGATSWIFLTSSCLHVVVMSFLSPFKVNYHSTPKSIGQPVDHISIELHSKIYQQWLKPEANGDLILLTRHETLFLS